MSAVLRHSVMMCETIGSKLIYKENIALPALCSKAIRIKVKACGLNFADMLQLEGKYQEIAKVCWRK